MKELAEAERKIANRGDGSRALLITILVLQLICMSFMIGIGFYAKVRIDSLASQYKPQVERVTNTLDKVEKVSNNKWVQQIGGMISDGEHKQEETE